MQHVLENQLHDCEDGMSTMMVLEQRKHDLRVNLVHTAKTYGKAARETQKVWHKIIEVQKAEAYLRRV